MVPRIEYPCEGMGADGLSSTPSAGYKTSGACVYAGRNPVCSSKDIFTSVVPY
jgi:hypothetical protein